MSMIHMRTNGALTRVAEERGFLTPEQVREAEICPPLACAMGDHTFSPKDCTVVVASPVTGLSIGITCSVCKEIAYVHVFALGDVSWQK